MSETCPRGVGSYTNKHTSKNDLYELPTYAQKLFLRDLLTSGSFTLQPGKDPGACFNHVTSLESPRAGASFRKKGEKPNHPLQ